MQPGDAKSLQMNWALKVFFDFDRFNTSHGLKSSESGLKPDVFIEAFGETNTKAMHTLILEPAIYSGNF
jgi:hypothetical protein